MTIYTLQEASAIVKISERTLREYIKQGKLKAVKLGNYWRITEENLVEFMKHGTQEES